jgi:hypothetical protein
VPWAYEMPRRKGMTAQLGCDHRFRSTVFASFCSRAVLMSLTIRTATRHSNVFIPIPAASRPRPADTAQKAAAHGQHRLRLNMGLTGLGATT